MYVTMVPAIISNQSKFLPHYFFNSAAVAY